MRIIRLLPALLICLVLVTGLGAPAHACPNCKEAVASQPEEVANMASGYNWSILLMIGVPFTLFGTGAFVVRRAARLGMIPDM